MPLQIIRQDITLMEVDAIVNPSNEELIPGGGVDATIHMRAGEELRLACQRLGGCGVAEAKITPAFNLPCKYVIHTVGPVWIDGNHNEVQTLIDSYNACLRLAVENGIESIAFPLISSGTYGFPKDQVLKLAMRAISDFLFDNELLVYIVVFDKTSYQISEKLFTDIEAYVDDNYAKEQLDEVDSISLPMRFDDMLSEECNVNMSRIFKSEKTPLRSNKPKKVVDKGVNEDDIEALIKHLDDTFPVLLGKIIDKKGLTDLEACKRSLIPKGTKYKIFSLENYKPSKNTILSFAIGLELSLDETNALLNTVGLSLSSSSKFDIIVKYFIENKRYNIFELNEVLLKFDLPLLGGVIA